MKAAVYREFGGPIRVEDVPVPHAPPGGVVVEVKATGVCRSDWHGWKGHDSDIADHGLPFTPGQYMTEIIILVVCDQRRCDCHLTTVDHHPRRV